MKNSDRYLFSDFTVQNYRNILAKAREKYVFKSFLEYSLDEDFIILRHDVDYSVHRAARLAEIEADLGIRSTYFILLHGEFYNVFEKKIADLVKAIIGMGHNIGLHFDSHFYAIQDESVLDEKLKFERNILEGLFEIKIRSFCFHITNPFTLACNKNEYAGMINAFSSFFQNDIGYCSDSNGYWRYKRLEDIIETHEFRHLQINLHPGWWQDEVMSPQSRIERCIEGRARYTKDLYLQTLTNTGRLSIDDQ